MHFSYYCQVVWDLSKADPLKHIKCKYVNMSKYRASVTCSTEELSSFSLRGFYLAITCAALGYKPSFTPVAGAASSSTDIVSIADSLIATPGVDVSSIADKTLKQASHAQNIKAGADTDPRNQLDRACKDFNNIANLFKQTQIARVLKPVVEYSGKHSKELRSLDATIPWDTNLITSASFTRT